MTKEPVSQTAKKVAVYDAWGNAGRLIDAPTEPEQSASEAQPVEGVAETKQAIAEDRAFLHGMEHGWNLGVVEDRDEFNRKRDCGYKAIRDAKAEISKVEAQREEDLADDWENWSASVKKAMYRFYRRLAENRGRQVASTPPSPSDMPELDVDELKREVEHWKREAQAYRLTAVELNEEVKKLLPAAHAGDSDMPEPLVSDGVALIATERKRQVESEGWTPEHDKQHFMGEIAAAASCYAMTAVDNDVANVEPFDYEAWWPWHPDWWKPSPDPIRNLVKAGALIAAEIDRLQKLAAKGVK